LQKIHFISFRKQALFYFASSFLYGCSGTRGYSQTFYGESFAYATSAEDFGFPIAEKAFGLQGSSVYHFFGSKMSFQDRKVYRSSLPKSRFEEVLAATA
jgi:hypothetical protein